MREPIRRAAAASLAPVFLLALLACDSADAPVPIALDRAVCTHCHMVVSELAFAAQLQTADGDVLNFDDPGCLLQWLAEHDGEIRSTWYHHLHEDRWLRESEVAFLPVERTPMDYGLGAVAAGLPGSLSLAQAETYVLERRQRLQK
jgi:copper chaperone NosL